MAWNMIPSFLKCGRQTMPQFRCLDATVPLKHKAFLNKSWVDPRIKYSPFNPEMALTDKNIPLSWELVRRNQILVIVLMWGSGMCNCTIVQQILTIIRDGRVHWILVIREASSKKISVQMDIAGGGGTLNTCQDGLSAEGVKLLFRNALGNGDLFY